MPKVFALGAVSDHMRARLAPHADIVDGDLGDEPVDAILMVGHTTLDADLMDRMDGLKLISNFGVGYDTIDAKGAAERGIMVSHTPNVLNEEVATTTMLLMLAGYRQLLRDDAYVRAGRWEAEGNAPLTRSADNRKVGILGLGRIGEAIAQKMQAFNADISYHSRSPKDVDYRYYDNLVDMARDVEVLVVITPGGAATRHMVNAEVLEALGPDGMLINVARGTVVDEAALIDALQSGKLGSAGLDVFENEPHVPEALRLMDNVVLLPHVGSGTIETRQAMADLAVDNVISFFESGKAITPVPECQDL